MKARYSKGVEGDFGRSAKARCKQCQIFDFFIVVERGADKENWNICSHCGHKIRIRTEVK